MWDIIIANPLQAAALCVAILGFIATVIIYYKKRAIKRLNYTVLTNIDLVGSISHRKELGKRIRILYEDTPGNLISIDDSRLLIVKFLNEGTEPIKPIDFVQPISIAFDTGVKILDPEVIEFPAALIKPEDFEQPRSLDLE